jgi:hypothetical protein
MHGSPKPPGMGGAPHTLTHDLVQPRAGHGIVFLLQPAPVSRKAHVVAGPALDHQLIQPGARASGHISRVKAPGVVAAELWLALDQSEACVRPLIEQRQRDQGILQPTPDQQVLLRGRLDRQCKLHDFHVESASGPSTTLRSKLADRPLSSAPTDT